MDEKELKAQLDGLKADLKTHFDKAAEQQKTQGTVAEELKATIAKLQTQVDAIDVKLAEKHAQSQPEETLEKSLEKHEGLQRIMRDKSGNCVIEFSGKQVRQMFERKTTIDSAAVGVATTGVLGIERIPGIVPEARETLRVRNALTARPTTMQLVDFVKVNVPMSIASPQTESSAKAENQVTFQAVSERVRVLATWIPASRQVLDDMSELLGFLQSSLPYYVNLAEDQQLLTGDGTGQNLNGLVTQATAFDTSLLTGGWDRIDVLGRVVQQITAAKEIAPTFVVLNPADWWDIRLTKDSYGRYILGDPMGPAGQKDLFGLTPIITTSMTSGDFLVGSGDPAAAEIRDRQGMVVEIATQHSDYFTKNLVAIRAEKRLCLVTKRTGSYVTGTFTTSP